MNISGKLQAVPGLTPVVPTIRFFLAVCMFASMGCSLQSRHDVFVNPEKYQGEGIYVFSSLIESSAAEQGNNYTLSITVINGTGEVVFLEDLKVPGFFDYDVSDSAGRHAFHRSIRHSTIFIRTPPAENDVIRALIRYRVEKGNLPPGFLDQDSSGIVTRSVPIEVKPNDYMIKIHDYIEVFTLPKSSREIARFDVQYSQVP